ncbi:ABC transporter permease [Kordia jejudonensis]|uniref:ABC transporter permease n=1 Tax=Kordia jejudonensis TaxID=1348245 RepID=UPI00062945C7|nr:ABC transporter permease [Kordia jejudonensis]
MVRTWLKLFFRNSKKNWLNTVINISGLTLGLVGLIIVLLYYTNEKSYDQWNTQKDIVYKVAHKWGDGQVYEGATNPEGRTVKEIVPEVVDYCNVHSGYDSQILRYKDRSIYETKIGRANANFFEFFPHEIIKGDAKTILATKTAIAISTDLEQQLFGEKDAVGKTIKYGKKEYIVTGVYKLSTPSVYMPNAILHKPISKSNNWGGYGIHTFYKIPKGTDLATVEKKIYDVYVDKYYKEEADGQGITVDQYVSMQGSYPILEKLVDLRLHGQGDEGMIEGKGNYLLLIIMLSLSILIILISSINFINLSIASASQRAKEVGVKKTLGLSKFSLQIQFILEIVLQGVISMFLALIVVELLLPIFNTFINKNLSLQSVEIILQVGLLALFISIVIGLITALYISNFKTISVLKGNFSRSGHMIFVRNVMLGLQFVISGFFFIGGLVVYAQVHYMSTKDLGFSGEEILVVEFNDSQTSRSKQYKLLKNVFQNNPNIEGISSTFLVPGDDNDISLDVTHKDVVVDIKFIPLDFGHLEMINTKISKGRYFSKDFASDTINSIIFNETAAKRLGIADDPIHKEVEANGKKFTVVGVVKDYHIEGLDKEIRPVFFMYYSGFDWVRSAMSTVQFKIKEGKKEAALAEIERFWTTELEPGYPFSFYYLDKYYSKTHDIYKKQQTLFFILTLVVIFIALLGLFALASLTIQQRLKEVAVRKTLGASVKQIIVQLVKSFIKITGIAVVVLIPIAYYFMQNWLNNFAYRIEMPLWPYIIAPIVLVLLVFVVVGIKALNATKVDLIKYLKFE